jgi:putative transposase
LASCDARGFDAEDLVEKLNVSLAHDPRGGRHMGGPKRQTSMTRRASTVGGRREKPCVPKVGEQLPLPNTAKKAHGGVRTGAGRKRLKTRSSVAHSRRPVHKGRHPVHVTLRATTRLPSFRQQRIYKMFTDVIRAQRKRRYEDCFRVIDYSVQVNHLHLIVEADTEKSTTKGYKALRSGISGLVIAFARRLNMMLGRRGSVWADRYHRHDLETPKEMWNGLGYVFRNFTHHGERTFGDGALDVFSSAVVFEGWDERKFTPHERERWRWPVCSPTTWLRSRGYLVHGRLPHPLQTG